MRVFQNEKYKGSGALALEPLCSKISSGGSLEKSSLAGACAFMYVRLFKHF